MRPTLEGGRPARCPRYRIPRLHGGRRGVRSGRRHTTTAGNPPTGKSAGWSSGTRSLRSITDPPVSTAFSGSELHRGLPSAAELLSAWGRDQGLLPSNDTASMQRPPRGVRLFRTATSVVRCLRTPAAIQHQRLQHSAMRRLPRAIERRCASSRDGGQRA